MLPAAKAVPKELLPVLGKPTIQYVVEEAAAAGSDDVLLITSRDKRAIEDHFDRTPELESRLAQTGKLEFLASVIKLREQVRVHAVRQAEQLGLGHAVLQARHHVGDRAFLCLLGDTIFTGTQSNPPLAMGGLLPAQQLVRAREALGGGDVSVIGLERVPREKVSKYGIVSGSPAGDGLFKVSALVEKPKPEVAPSDLAIAARYLLSPKIFAHLDRVKPGTGGEIQLTDALNTLAAEGKVYGVILDSRRHDIGSPEGWLATNLRLARDDAAMWKHIEPLMRELLAK